MWDKYVQQTTVALNGPLGGYNVTQRSERVYRCNVRIGFNNYVTVTAKYTPIHVNRVDGQGRRDLVCLAVLDDKRRDYLARLSMELIYLAPPVEHSPYFYGGG